ncbi:HAD family phosphatase [Fulvivirga sp. M361]|uniref:HAD family hydrolase n=1 Tax=Fulvivirga sp. M361 TaxID=2594266 RepID=UPI00117A7223|nr:HAD family phosphatase [Fulvivirga sp. M361]TRX60667.1 HAD family phosphatase [Fulvivirga sp. M361]
MNNIKGIIFDMDGTLLDNMHHHREAWLFFLKKHHIELSPEQFDKQNHGSLYEIIKRFFPGITDSQKISELGQEKEAIYRQRYKDVKEIEGLSDLLLTLQEKKVKALLGTMGDIPNIDFVLDHLNIREFFDSITGGHEVSQGKPNPEIFLLSMKKSGLKADECVVIEDTISGIQAAKRADIRVIGITTSFQAGELMQHGCDHVIGNFQELKALLFNQTHSSK